MVPWRYLILHALSEKLGVYLPETLIDEGLSSDDPVFMAREIIKKIRPSRDIDPHQIIDGISEHIHLNQSNKVKVITKCDPLWPKELNFLYQSPHVLYFFGEISKRKKIAIIGSRTPPRHCINAAHQLATAVAHCGFDIVSGGAIGCDIAGHHALVQNSMGSQAMLVLPGGLGHPYPRQNVCYFNRIIDQGGCWISERPYFHQPKPHDFLIRNRIIVGMSLGIIVIHGDERSGTSTTVRIALNQGKEIYVSSVGIEDSPLGKRLIAEGAEILHC